MDTEPPEERPDPDGYGHRHTQRDSDCDAYGNPDPLAHGDAELN